MLARLVGPEDRDAAGAFAIHAIGPGVEVGEDEVVLDAVVVHQTDLDDVAVLRA